MINFYPLVSTKTQFSHIKLVNMNRKQFSEEMTMATDMTGASGAFRRLMNKVARWSEALNYSGFDYTVDRIAFVERELAAIKDRMRQFEASPREPPDVLPMRQPAE